MKEKHPAIVIQNRIESEVDEALGSVGPGIVDGFPVGCTLGGERGGRPDFVARFLKVFPPWGLPKRPSQNLLRAIAAGLQAELIRVNQDSVQGHNAGEYGCLLEDSAKLRGRGKRFLRHLPFAFLRLFSFGDIAGDGKVDSPSVQIAKRSSMGFHVPALTLESHNVALERAFFSGTDLLVERAKLLAMFRSYEIEEAFPND